LLLLQVLLFLRVPLRHLLRLLLVFLFQLLRALGVSLLLRQLLMFFVLLLLKLLTFLLLLRHQLVLLLLIFFVQVRISRSGRGGALSGELVRAKGWSRLRRSARTLAGIPVPTRPA